MLSHIIHDRTRTSRRKQTWQFLGEDDYWKTRNNVWPSLRELVIVPGHAIHTCTTASELTDAAGDCWYLLQYQKNQRPLFLEHIRRGAQMAKDNPQAMLIYSGGQTRGCIGPISEAYSYYKAGQLTLGSVWFEVRNKIVLEEYARDSFENLVFSVARFKQATGKWPEKVSVIGFPFKEARFNELHWPTLKEKLSSNIVFEYISVSMEGMDQDGIIDDAYPLFRADLLGNKAPLLNKRQQRDPFNRPHPYSSIFPWLNLNKY